MNPFIKAFLLALGLACVSVPAMAVGRVYVATAAMGGDDANVSSNCSIDFPCRLFATAYTVVDSGGEMVVLNSGQYGLLTINKSLAITAAPGIFTGIAPSSGYGFLIDGSGIEVKLRGLTIRGNGGSAAIRVDNAAKVTVENCLIFNFKPANNLGAAIDVVSTGTELRVVNSVLRDNNYGVAIYGGGTAYISNSVITGNIAATSDSGAGVLAKGDLAGQTATVHVTDSVITGNHWGITAVTDGGSARAFVTRSMVANNHTGVDSDTLLGGTQAAVFITGNSINGNSTGLSIQGAGASMTSYSSNMISGNITKVNGTLTSAVLE